MKEIKQKIFNLIMKNGKKQTSEKLFLKSVKLLQKSSKKNTINIMKTSIVNSSPLTKMRIYRRNKKRKTKHVISFPFLLTFKQKNTLGIKNLILLSQDQKNSKSFFNNFYDQLINASNKQGKIIENISKQHNESFLKKKFSNFRWF
jgi:ribosomal protein S7